jgi:hypothetical protein
MLSNWGFFWLIPIAQPNVAGQEMGLILGLARLTKKLRLFAFGSESADRYQLPYRYQSISAVQRANPANGVSDRLCPTSSEPLTKVLVVSHRRTHDSVLTMSYSWNDCGLECCCRCSFEAAQYNVVSWGVFGITHCLPAFNWEKTSPRRHCRLKDSRGNTFQAYSLSLSMWNPKSRIVWLIHVSHAIKEPE